VSTLSKTRFLYSEYSNRELYAGQGNLSDIRRELRTFQILVRYPGDGLFWNPSFAKLPWKAYWTAWLTYLRSRTAPAGISGRLAIRSRGEPAGMQAPAFG
jgi:hypothetical protein